MHPAKGLFHVKKKVGESLRCSFSLPPCGVCRSPMGSGAVGLFNKLQTQKKTVPCICMHGEKSEKSNGEKGNRGVEGGGEVREAFP